MSVYTHTLESEVFEYIAVNNICTIDKIAKDLTITKNSAKQVVELLVKFGLLEYKDEYNLCISLSKIAKVILD